jgi:hypothetical protein
MKSRCFSLLLVVMAVIAVRAVAEDDSVSTLPRFVQTKKESAEFSLTLSCSLDGVFSKEERIFYFRARRGDMDGMYSESSHSNADGEGGTGYGFSARVDARNTAVDLEIDTYWTTRTAHGKSDIELLVPYLTTKEGKEAGYTYSVRWKKLK